MAKQTVKPRVRKKKWFPVIAPTLFRENVIGEIPLYESEAMLNRIMNVNMMNLTGNPRNQQINVMLRIKEIKDGKGLTEILGYEMMPSSVKRIVRRGRTKVGDSIIVATKDNKKVKIKPLLITRTISNKSIVNSIRLNVRNNLVNLAGRLTYDQLVEEIISFKLQKHLGSSASKIAPVKRAEIRGFKLIEKEGVRVLKPVKVKEDIRTKEETAPAEEKTTAVAEEKPKVEAKKEEVKAEETKEVKKEEEAAGAKKEEVKPKEKKEEPKVEVKEEKKPEPTPDVAAGATEKPKK